MSQYPNAFYRVSVKAVIRNEDGQVLLIKEHIDDWVLPGGGLDHGEDPQAALKRELQEELGVVNIKSAQLVKTYTLYASRKDAWYMWLLYDVKLESLNPDVSSYISETAFIDIATFKDSSNRAEKRIYEALI